MKVRYEFGPRIDGSFPLPSIHGDLTDVQVGATAKKARKAGKGLIHLDMAFQIPAYDPTEHNQLLEVHAVAYAPGVAIPTTPEDVLASDQPKVSADASTHTDGSELPVTIPNATPGALVVVTVLGFADTTPDPDPATIVPSEPTTTEANETVATAPSEPTSTPEPVADPQPAATADPATVADPAPVEVAPVVADPVPSDPAPAAPSVTPPATN